LITLQHRMLARTGLFWRLWYYVAKSYSTQSSQARRGPKVILSRFAIQPASSIIDAASVIAKHSLSFKHILPTLLRTAGSQVTPPRKSQMKTTPRHQYPVSTLPSSYWYFSTPPQVKTCWHEHPKESKRVYKGLQSRNQDSYRSANALQSSQPP
jgi:hypothetical protein